MGKDGFKSGRGKKLPHDLKIVIIVAAVCVALTAVLLIINIFTPIKYLSVFWVSADDKSEAGQMRVRFIDVGQGDCTLIEFPDGTTMLADGGDGGYAHCKNIFRVLNKSGIDKIDYLVCTSVSTLRSGGLSEIMKYKEVGKIFAPYCIARNVTEGYASFREAADGREIEYCEYGNGVFGDGYGFCFLAPNSHLNTDESSDYYKLNTKPTDDSIDNASACVYAYYGDTAVLLLGDARPDRQRVMFYDYLSGYEINGVKISLDNVKLVKAAGHGGIKSACTEFYDYIKPQYTVISASGEVAPSMQVIADAERYSELFTTYNGGTVTAIIKNENVTVFDERG